MILITEIAIIISFFILGAYATTDYVRLSSLGTAPISDGSCFCPVCNNKLRLVDQIPTVSYIASKGRCHFCNAPIPKNDFYLEIIVYSVSTIISILTRFTYFSFILVIIFYELCKTVFIIKNGKRKKDFAKSLIYSIILNIIIFALIFALFSMKIMVSNYIQAI